MPIDPLQLLRRLEPPVRPGSSPDAARAGAEPIERQSFDSLLALVTDGSVKSDRPVTVRADATIEVELDAAQLEQIASAADLAQSSGASRAVLLLAGRGLLLDVEHREITGELRSGDVHRLVHIDAAIQIADDCGHEGAEAVQLPRQGVLPDALARLLEPEAANADSTRRSPFTKTTRRAG